MLRKMKNFQRWIFPKTGYFRRKVNNWRIQDILKKNWLFEKELIFSPKIESSQKFWKMTIRHYSSPNMLNFFWKFFILKFCFGAIRVDIELCTSRSQSSGILAESQGQKDALFFRWQHEPKYKMLKTGYLYTSRSEIQSLYLKGIDSLLLFLTINAFSIKKIGQNLHCSAKLQFRSWKICIFSRKCLGFLFKKFFILNEK